jgi:tetratricopeptide (TPR) repeat protein/outer membrane biosynthesis protein TonB
MSLSAHRMSRIISLLACTLAFFLCGESSQFAQGQTEVPARTGYVNDFAGVVDEKTKLQLTNLLENLKQKAGIDFAVVTVPSIAGKDIFGFSRQVAMDWNVGARATKNKSLLLVLATNEKESFTQFSRSVQGDLPEAVLGDMSQRMKALISAGDFGGGLNAGVHHFVSSMAQKLAMNVSDFESAPSSVAMTPLTAEPANEPAVEVKPPPTRAVRPRIAKATPTPETEVAETKPVDQPTPVTSAPITIEASTKVTEPTPPSESTSTPTKKSSLNKAPTARNENTPARKLPEPTPEDDADESEEVELTLTLPLEARITRLKEFLADYPDSKSKPRAIELLVSAHAGVGDQRLKKGDTAGGLEQLMLAINTAPPDMSEKLFSGVIAQIPLNLYLRGERASAAQVAQTIETKFGTDAKRLIALTAFYITTEQSGEAVRIATQAVTLAPDMSDAHRTLGLALHISLRLEEALAEYKRALDIDANSKAARMGLADLSRGLGKSEEALALYSQQLAIDGADKAARAGMVLSLFDLGRTDEAKTELDAALKADPKNLSLLAGAAYWFAAHGDTAQANEYGRKALEIEPRYTWSHVAMARTLVAQRKPLNAERALRFARQYGKFPTLDYELANALVAAGLFAEAAEVLTESFDWKDGRIETRLAGRTSAQANSFTELLAPERRGSIFQSVAADNESTAKLLKDLLVFTVLSNQDQKGGNLDEQSIVAAAREFASGSDPAKVHRQLYAASRLLQKGIGFSTAHELAEAARSTADAGLTVPEVTLAVQADEYREIRARAIAQGGTPDIAEAPRNILSNLLRGRIEDISGWALFNQDKAEEAVDHLRRASNILPERTPVWRTALWHLGAALERLDKSDEALIYYIRSYSVGDPEPGRRSVIERLYRKKHGSLTGLDEQIGAAFSGIPTQVEASSVADKSSAPAQSSSPEVTPNAAPVTAETPKTEAPTIPASTSETKASPEPSTPAPTAAPEPASVKPANPAAAIVESIQKPRPSIVTIKGRVVDAANNPIANAVVVLISPQGTVLASTTDEQGTYSFKVAPSSHNYRVIPSKDGFRFEPGDRLLPGVSEDQTGMNFVGIVKSSP